MDELDFSKIFGETATSKASFTDENYINGWGYLGSTPPPYQLFDYLQGLNDKKSKYLYDNINENKNNLLAHNTDLSAHTAILNAHNADVNAHSPITEMIGKILGATNWQENPVATLKDIKNTLGIGGIVAQKLEDNGYVKFANGLTFQWGSTTNHSADVNITFPIAFSTKCFCGLVTAQKSTNYLTGSQCNPAVRIANTTGMVALMYDSSHTGWYWLAIGI